MKVANKSSKVWGNLIIWERQEKIKITSTKRRIYKFGECLLSFSLEFYTYKTIISLLFCLDVENWFCHLKRRPQIEGTKDNIWTYESNRVME